MKKYLLSVTLIIGVGILLVQCDESTIIGSDFLSEEAIDFQFTDTFTIHTFTQRGIPVNSGRVSANTYMIGALDDPIFGKTNSDIYFGIQVLDDGPMFENQIIDSMVLIIAYDSLGFYGKQDARFDFELFKTTERINEDTTFSDEVLDIESEPLASELNKYLSVRDTIFTFDPVEDTSIVLQPHFRMKILPQFGINIFTLFKLVTDDESLLSLIPALYLKGTPDRSAMAGLSIGNTNRLGDLNKLTLFFTNTENDLKTIYDFRFRIDKFSTFTHDYTGSQVEPFLDNKTDGDSLFFVQGMAGVNGVVDISNALQLKDYLINKAELELTVAEDSEYNLECYPPIELFAASYEGIEGNRIAIQDLDLISTGGLGVFGGNMVEEIGPNGEMVRKVIINITNHIKNYINDPSIGGEILLSPFFDSETPNRTVFYGAGHSMFPAKVNISFTKP